MQTVLKMHIGPQDIAACHPLVNGSCVPVIVKFLYHYHRDLAWDRKTNLRLRLNSQQRPIFVRECLAPVDREIQAEAKRLDLRTTTRNQQVFVSQQNGRNQPSYNVNHINELKSLTPNNFEKPSTEIRNKNPGTCFNPEVEYVTVGNSSESNVDFATPQRMPTLQRKPITAFFDDKRTKKRALDLSPILET